VPDYQFTPYFENQVLRKRPYLAKEMCIRVVRSLIRAELQGNDAEGNLVGIDIDHASQKLNLRELVTTHIPLEAKAQS
jgi:hypothetical protein